MRAVTIPSKGRLELAERPIPRPVDDQVLIRVAAAGLNRGDLWQLAGGYPPPADAPQDIPGMEFAGTVEAIGPAAKRLKVGDRVYGLVGGGAQAEFVAAYNADQARLPFLSLAVPLRVGNGTPDWRAPGAQELASSERHEVTAPVFSLRPPPRPHALHGGCSLAGNSPHDTRIRRFAPIAS